MLRPKYYERAVIGMHENPCLLTREMTALR